MTRNKIKNTLGFRKIKGQKGQFTGIGLLIVVGVAFFITLFTIAQKYEQAAPRYFEEQNYATITLYGNFTQKEVAQLADDSEVITARGRVVQDFREGDTVYRAVTLTKGVNTPYFYSGSMPKGDSECLLLQKNAQALQKKLGDTLTVDGKKLKITGLIASPEYVYLVQNERSSMAQADKFAVVYVNSGFYKNQPLNEIVAVAKTAAGAERLAKEQGFENYTLQEKQINYQNYREDLGQIRSFAYIFPSIFALLIAAIVYVMLARTIARERKQIGICMALGATSGQIKGMYLLGYLGVAVPSALLGGGAAMLLTDQIIVIFKSMFELPLLQYEFYPALWGGSLLFVLLLCGGAGVLTMGRALGTLPAEAMRMRQPRGGRKILLERIPAIWGRLSFHTRYAIKNALRNKGRFFAVVLGMCAACALIVFSLGFYDSIKQTTKGFLSTYANYDAIISLEPTPAGVKTPGEKLGAESQRALLLPVKVGENETTVTAVEEGFDMLKIQLPDDGVVIPRHFANLWGVKEGDSLEIEGMTVKVAAVIKQNIGLSIYGKRPYFEKVDGNFPPVYNTVFLRADNKAQLLGDLKDSGYTFTTIEDDESVFDSAAESLQVLIYVLIACSVLLGGTVLYSVGLITLSAREYEYLFLGVMGYSDKKILLAQAKETLFQLVLAIPLGLVLGKALIYGIKGEFSGDNFVIDVAVLPQSYFIAVGITLAIVACMVFVTARYIRKLDIVQGLKVQEE